MAIYVTVFIWIQFYYSTNKRGNIMKFKKEPDIWFEQICRQRTITLNELANMSAITPSNIYSMLNNSRKDIAISAIKKLCTT